MADVKTQARLNDFMQKVLPMIDPIITDYLSGMCWIAKFRLNLNV